jgi:hypothetical protein
VHQIERRAAQIPDAAARAVYVTRVRDHVQAFELHRCW